jgi:hypothetical protein
MADTTTKAKLRVAGFLSGGTARRREAAKPGTLLLDAGERGKRYFAF